MRMSSKSMTFGISANTDAMLSAARTKAESAGQTSSAFMETLAALQKEGDSLQGGILRSGKKNPVLVTTKKIMPDGTILITTKKDGKIVEQTKKKPHMLPVYDHVSGEVKMEPFQSVFMELM